jgi:hypothetical protein
MRRAMILALVGGLHLPSAVQAQQWSPEQEEVLQAVTDCWDLWMDGVEQGSPDPWLDNCETDDATFWVGNEGVPQLSGADFLRRNWGDEIGVDLGWVDLRPIVISVHDDVAVLHFYGYWRRPGSGLEEWKRTEVWQMQNGRWRQWAGHATPVSRQ